MQKKTIEVLLKELEQEMQRLGYTEKTMNFYRRRWNMLLQFSNAQKEIYYSEKLGIDFLKEKFSIFEEDFDQVLSQKDTQELRVIRMIGDFQIHNTILRRYYKHHVILTDPYYKQVSHEFTGYCEKRDYSKVTVNHYVKQSERFMDFLIAHEISNCSEITLELVHSYIKTLSGYTYKTVEQCICAIRCFFRYLLEEEILKDDLASKTPMVQARKQTRIPSVWTKEELSALVKAIDRGNPKGKRDYAIILLACVLGLRGSDIKKLTFDCFNWQENKITFVQSKTRETVTLPLPAEVGWAVIDYLKHGRPNAYSSVVFIRHLAPFLPFSEEDHMHQIIQVYMRRAHIPTLKKKRGMHSLRHTAASRMLEKGTSLEVISDILGHIDTESTSVYLKIDVSQLKQCSLETPEVNGNE